MSGPERPAQALPSSSSLIVTLTLIAMLSGLLVVGMYEYTRPIIAENQRVATEKAIFDVLPSAASRLTFLLVDGRLVRSDDRAGGTLIYAGYDSQGKLVGMALPASAQGYQDTIRILYGYDPQSGCITGYNVLKSTETPGFGTQIETNADFLANFQCLDARVDNSLSALLHVIRTVRHGSKQKAWEIDAISGSTITSNAVGRMLNQSAQALHPVIARNLQFLQQAADNRQ